VVLEKVVVEASTSTSCNEPLFLNPFDTSENPILPKSIEVGLQTDFKCFSEIGTQTDTSISDMNQLEFAFKELSIENSSLKQTLLKYTPLTQEFLSQNEKCVKFYTGLPSFAILMFVFDFVAPYVKSANTGESKFKEFLMFMIKIRLSLPLADIGFRFGVSTASVCRYFHKWLEVMYVRLTPFVRWPTRQEIINTTPTEFKEVFGNKIAVIIDCFEVFIERPSSLNIRASTYSFYKSHNTAKYLIGIAPQGMITFISNGWGGRTSDKRLTEGSGFLDNLLPGDIVMADRGFNIAEVLSVMNTSLLIPSFTRGLKQLAPKDIEKSRKIANLRIHIERVIGVVRQKYNILSSTIPIQFLKGDVTPLDKITLIACSLVNMTESVVGKKEKKSQTSPVF